MPTTKARHQLQLIILLSLVVVAAQALTVAVVVGVVSVTALVIPLHLEPHIQLPLEMVALADQALVLDQMVKTLFLTRLPQLAAAVVDTALVPLVDLVVVAVRKMELSALAALRYLVKAMQAVQAQAQIQVVLAAVVAQAP